MNSEAPSPVGSQSFRLGAGLLLGLLLGHRSLIAAATGTEQFELAIAHFVFVVLASMVGVVAVASTFERMVNTEDEDEDEDEASDDGSDDPGDALVAAGGFTAPELSPTSPEFTAEP